MKRLSLPVFLDGILSFIISFFVSYCIFKLLKFDNLLCLLISFTISLLLSLCVFFVSIRYSNKHLLSKKCKKERFFAINKLSTMNNSELLNLFKTFFHNIVEIDDNKCLIKTKLNCIYLKFLPEPLSANDVCSIIKNTTVNENVVIIGNTFSPLCISFCKTNNIKLLSIDEVYKFLKQYNPEFFIESVVAKNKFYTRFRGFISRKNALKLIFYGFTLDFFSLLAIYPLYYVVSGSLFIIIGTISLFVKNSPALDKFSFENLV